MLVIRKIIGALLILAGLAVAGYGVWVCSYALDAEPRIEDAEGGPTETLEQFLSCMEQKDWDGAYEDLYNYASLGLETWNCLPVSAPYWEQQTWA